MQEKKGVDASKYEFLLFCDDDNWLQQDYVRYAYETMSATETIGVLGGRSKGAFETEEPFWFSKFAQAYAIGRPNKTSGNVNARTYIAGAAMVVRRQALELLESLAFTPLLTGRKGKLLTSGEDSELCLLFLYLGYDLYYDERLEFIHFITTNRLSWKYCVAMMSEGHAIPQVYFQFYNYCHKQILQNEKPEFKKAYAAIRQKLLRQVLRTFIHTKPFWYSFRLLTKSQPGSRKEIELKANINKLRYLLKNKKGLKKDFESINTVVQNIQQYKNSLSYQLS